ncbi:hypothetical protein [Sorangium sp. So ce341]
MRTPSDGGRRAKDRLLRGAARGSLRAWGPPAGLGGGVVARCDAAVEMVF